MNGLAKTGHQGFPNALRGCVLAALFLGLAGSSPAQTNAPAAKPYVLPWIADVVKMSTAGVPQDVIQVYIKNSSARSTLTPDDIVYLRDSGVATGIINTMIEHGAAQPPAVPATAYAAAQPQPAPQAPVYTPTPQYYDQPVTYPDQPSTSVTYIGGSYPYYNGYPYYAYPTWYYPSVFFVGSRVRLQPTAVVLGRLPRLFWFFGSGRRERGRAFRWCRPCGRWWWAQRWCQALIFRRGCFGAATEIKFPRLLPRVPRAPVPARARLWLAGRVRGKGLAADNRGADAPGRDPRHGRAGAAGEIRGGFQSPPRRRSFRARRVPKRGGFH